ncbi:MAG: ThuA domain-containing protein [Limisphaerales bacterium]
MKIKTTLLAFALTFALGATAAPKPLPLRALLITGGCCHDYKMQKDILKKGLEARAHVVVDQIHSDDKSTNPPLENYGNPDYAKGYDVIIHDECAAKMDDVKTVNGVLAPHKQGIPGVNLHCAMHSFRVANPREKQEPGSEGAIWFDYLGLQSSGHGPKAPVKIEYSKHHPITQGLKNWTTGPEELYNNVFVHPSATPLSIGHQTQKPRKNRKTGKLKAGAKAVEANAVITWINEYKGARVFSTTMGHYNETVADDRYLDLVTRGLLWSCDKLNEKYLKD